MCVFCIVSVCVCVGGCGGIFNLWVCLCVGSLLCVCVCVCVFVGFVICGCVCVCVWVL